MFRDDGFEAGNEFINKFITNMYSKFQMPGTQMIDIGESFTELMMIERGVVTLWIDHHNGREITEYQFFILPSLSFFGDYQILYDLNSQARYKSGDNTITRTMNLSQEVLIKLMDNYPQARQFYMKRAWERRKEFRRRQKRFTHKISKIISNF